MKINQKILSIVVIVWSLITISLAIVAFYDKRYMDIMMIFLGIIKGNKKVGIFAISIGVLIIGMVIIKVIV